MNFKACIIRLRLQEAKRLLLETDFTISEIAVELGLSRNSYSGSIFKKYEGILPGNTETNTSRGGENSHY